MRWRTPRSALMVALVGLAMALQFDVGRPSPPAADAMVVAADGDLDLRNSSDGMPILNASGLGPGDTASGQVTVSNAGTGHGQFSLKRLALSGSPGAGGGALSDKLQLVVSDVTVPASPSTVYEGTLGAMPERGLGVLGPGEGRVYEFEASFPDGGSADNAYVGAAASVTYKWTASSRPENPPASPPAGPGTPPSGGSGEPSNSGAVPTFVQPRLGLSVKLAKAQTVKRKTLALSVRCTQACRIAASGRLGAKGVKKALGNTRIARSSGKAGRWVKVTLKLPAKTLARMALAKGQRKRTTLTVTVKASTADGSQAKIAESGVVR